jgi:hypothetical protein
MQFPERKDVSYRVHPFHFFDIKKEKTMRTCILKPIAFCLAFAALAVLAQPALAGLLVNYQFESVSGDTGSQTTPDSGSYGLTGTLLGSTTFGYPTIVASPTPLHPGDNPNSVMSSPGGGGARYSTTYPRLEVADAVSGPLDAAFVAFTFAAWTNPNAATDAELLAGKMSTSSNRGWQIVRSPDANNINALEFAFYQGAASTSPYEDIYVPGFFSDNTWSHVGITFSASPDGVTPGAVNFYKDGTLFYSKSTLLTALNGANSNPFQVGNRGVVYNTPSWNGYIDDVRIYDEALSSTAIGDLAGVPEPGTLILLFAGLIGMVTVYRRR